MSTNGDPLPGLPPPAVDPELVQAINPELSDEQATLAAQLATASVLAVIYPNEIPDPQPAPVSAVLLSVATRYGIAIAQGTASPVVSESIGSYSYRLATPQTLGGAFGLTEDELATLQPWGSGGGVYELSLVGDTEPWPPDWWQRNLEDTDW